MGTRGIMGFRVNGIDYLSYNHFDSYVSGLGVDMKNDIMSMVGDWGLEQLKEKAKRVRLVTEEVTPTPEEIKSLAEHTDLKVSSQTTDEWYTVLRELQGNLKGTISAGYMIDGHSFVNDSLFCEWGYIANLDKETLEVYKGFQTNPHSNGRYALPESDGREYYPISLITTIPFADLPEDNAEFILMADRDGALTDYLYDIETIDIKTAKENFGIELHTYVKRAKSEKYITVKWINETTIRFDG